MPVRAHAGGWLLVFVLAACSDVRERPAGSGFHPEGWAEPGAAEFHGAWLRDNGHPLQDCRSCHGDDDEGGNVAVSCKTAGCHTSPEGVNACGTCHGSFDSDPLPASGAHANHVGLCSSCHTVPATPSSAGHLDGTIDVTFSGLATQGGASPVWNAATGTCAASYCHGGAELSWRTPSPVSCTSCHGEPPISHAAFARVATVGSCTSCHPDSSAATHINGTVDIIVERCDSCHGRDGAGAPPVALDGATEPTHLGVGAHLRHLSPTLAGRTGKTARCDQCHVVPETVTAPGHLGEGTAEVTLPQGGTYAAGTQTCQVWCHWNKSAGPTWTDTSGAARACDGCHAFPLTETRAGTPHINTAPDVNVCRSCHLFTPETHVNGTVDFVFAAK